MKKLLYLFSTVLLLGTISSCDTLSNLPTNTTGGVFSLNGRWTLTSSSENNAMVGTVINVTPVVGNASVVSLSNNTYCLREKDIIWRSITSSGAGGFTISALVSSCNGSTIYRDATVTVITNNEIRVSGKTASGAELLQTFY
jgi:hypothetical protein